MSGSAFDDAVTFAEIGAGRLRVTFQSPDGETVLEIGEAFRLALQGAAAPIPRGGFGPDVERSTKDGFVGRVGDGALDLCRRAAQVRYGPQGALAPDLLFRGPGGRVEVHCDLDILDADYYVLHTDPATGVSVAVALVDRDAIAALHVDVNGHASAHLRASLARADHESTSLAKAGDPETSKTHIETEDAV